ncbi:hypothetical protein IAD21_05284 [Abditibacteriota bacterium]|nr:hypothetical protein IAD21_05284 [Abditibacteriota bacterium]
MKGVENERANPNLVWNTFDEEATILDVSTGNYFSLNPVATEVWNGLHQGRSQDEIVEIIAQKYETDPEMVKADVIELIAELRESKLWS